MAEPSGTYADVVVLEKRRIRVSFNGKTRTSEVLAKLQSDDIYDITDEETYSYEKVLKVEWMEDNVDLADLDD